MAYFLDELLTLLRQVLDRIIPAEGKFPGAGKLDVAGYIDNLVAQSAELKHLFTEGLAQIQIASKTMHSQEFANLSSEAQDTVLRRVEATHPAFFQALVRQTYNGYYTNPRIIRLLGLEARPPQPRGYKLEPFDLTLAERVKQRPQLWKNAS
jgi:hypothetical protein